MLGTVKTLWNLPDAQARVNALRRPFVLRLVRLRARAALEEMSDHLLADIGLSRADIPAAVEALIERDFPATAPQPAAALPAEPELRRAA